MTKKYGDLNLLTVFLEVYRLRSITLASEALDMSQPAVSNAMNRFREQIGEELFVREGRGISPTSTAHYLAIELEPMMKHIDRTIDNLNEFDVSSSRSFKVLLPEPLLYALHKPLESDPRLGNCQIEYDIIPPSRSELLKLLSLQKVDLAIDVTPVDNLSYKSELICEDPLTVICSENHPRVGDSISMTEYLGESHVALELKRQGLHALDYYTKEQFQRRIRMECSSTVAMIAMVSAGELLGVTSEMLYRQYAVPLKVRKVAVPFEISPIQYHMVYHKKMAKNPALQWLTSFVRTITQEMQTQI
ncbi:LysR family transcriptional regulator [Vibrio variabilis]|uniref:LysR family transcriptional regulator n=1 Tax=Vibrio variabilis TaxID=990271 RepID=UPI0013A6FE70|nr:LysR family transcriptional regulator [Vibrio variabilis]